MSKINKTIFFINVVVVVSFASIVAVYAWTNPSTNPPGGSGVLSSQNGKVGIGTATPSYLLHVSSSTDSLLGITRVGGTYPTEFRQGTDNSLVIKNSNSDTLFFKNGNVGVGVSPTYKLDVSGDVRWTGTLQSGSVPWTRLTSFPPACPGGQYVSAVGGTLTCSVPTVSEGDGVIGNEVTTATNSTLTRSGSGTAVSPYTLGLNWGNANSWTGAQTFGANTNFPGSGIWNTLGNVGIGTTAPGTKLEVAGQVKITGGLPGSGKVLTSDSVGLATWQTPASSGVTSVTGSSGVTASPTTGAVGVSLSYPSKSCGAGTAIQSFNLSGSANPTCVSTAGTNYWTLSSTSLYPNSTTYNLGAGTASLDSNYKITTAGGGIKAESTSQPAGYFNSSSGYGLLVNTGNVGIGTLAPGYKLTVNGIISASSNVIKNVAIPVDDSDAATKGYVNAQVGSSGINVKQATCSISDCITTATCNSGTIITSAVSVNGTTACGSGAQANPTATYRTRADCWGNSSCSQTGTRTPSPLGACVAIVCEK